VASDEYSSPAVDGSVLASGLGPSELGPLFSGPQTTVPPNPAAARRSIDRGLVHYQRWEERGNMSASSQLTGRGLSEQKKEIPPSSSWRETGEHLAGQSPELQSCSNGERE
jgi:hypothetical protein